MNLVKTGADAKKTTQRLSAAVGPKVAALACSAANGNPRACAAIRAVAVKAKRGDPRAQRVAKRLCTALKACRSASLGGWAWNVPYRTLAARPRRLRGWYLRGLAAS